MNKIEALTLVYELANDLYLDMINDPDMGEDMEPGLMEDCCVALAIVHDLIYDINQLD